MWRRSSPTRRGSGSGIAAATPLAALVRRLNAIEPALLIGYATAIELLAHEQPADAAYRPVPAGQPSHTVLLTNLANRVQPIIRYDLGDRVTVSSALPMQ